MRLVFCGTPQFAVPTLKQLIGAGHAVELVVTQPDRVRGRDQDPSPPPVKVLAGAAGLPVMQPEKIKNNVELRVRLEAIRGLVSLTQTAPVAGAAADPSREVRVAVAEGLGILAAAPAGPAGPENQAPAEAGLISTALCQLAADADPLVRAAAFTAAGAAGCPPPLDALADRKSVVWERV